MRTIQASEFKAKCLQILDEVQATGETVRITKRGKVVARLIVDDVDQNVDRLKLFKELFPLSSQNTGNTGIEARESLSGECGDYDQYMDEKFANLSPIQKL